VERARAFAKRLNSSPLAIIDKRREEANVAEVMNVVGDVEGRHCLLVDDLIDTAGTLVKGAEALIEKGAASVSACATHAVLSGPAVERIEASGLKEVVFTNSIPLADEAKRSSRIKSLSVGHFAGGSHPIDSRRDFGERAVYLKLGRQTTKSDGPSYRPQPTSTRKGRTGLAGNQGEFA